MFIEKYSGKELVLHEGKRLGWFTLEEAENMVYSNRDKEAIRAVKKFLEGIKK